MSLAVLNGAPLRVAAWITSGAACAVALVSAPSLRRVTGLLVRIAWLYVVSGARG